MDIEQRVERLENQVKAQGRALIGVGVIAILGFVIALALYLFA